MDARQLSCVNCFFSSDCAVHWYLVGMNKHTQKTTIQIWRDEYVDLYRLLIHSLINVYNQNESEKDGGYAIDSVDGGYAIDSV